MTRTPTRRLLGVGLAAAAVVAVAACSPSDSTESGPTDPDSSESSAPSADGSESTDDTGSTEVDEAAMTVTSNVEGADVPVDSLAEFAVEDGTLSDVVVRGEGPEGAVTLEGGLSDDGTTWTASDRLEPGTTYVLRGTGVSEDGESSPVTARFTSQDLTLAQQTYPSIAPLDGSQVGVGMPVIVTFDIPVTDRAAMERQMSVTTSPQVEGSWSWLSDSEVHYRPKDYWPANTTVDVDLDVNGVKVGPDLWAQDSRQISFTTGDAVVSTVDVANHTMDVTVNGETVRTLDITTGKPGYETRAGTKVVMEKFDVKRMDAATTGVEPGDPEYYNIPDVQWAMRVTYSGEFVHAAPWSEGSQGSENVSHGCVGLSTSDAEWLYSMSSVGDVITFVNSPRTLDAGNGWTDWDVSYREFAQGSAV